MRLLVRRSRPAVAAVVCLLTSVALSTPSFGQGLPDAAAAKAADKCQKEIKKAGAKFVGKKLKILDKCTSGIFKCIQTQDDQSKCIGKSRDKCVSELGKIAGEEAKYRDSIVAKCGTVSVADLRSTAGLGYANVDYECEGSINSVTDIATCVVEKHECRTELLYLVQEPRAKELMEHAGVASSIIDGLECFPPVGGSGADVEDAKGVGKAIDKCAKALAKAGTTFATKKLKGLEKCLDKIFTCEQTKQSDLVACVAKAKTTCDKEFDTNIPKAKVKLESTIDKGCSTIDFAGVLGASEGLNLAVLTKECPEFGVPSLTTLAHYKQCIFQQHECRVDEMLRFEVPRIVQLLASVNRPPHAAFCPGPSPTPSVTATPVLTATPTATPTPIPTVTQTPPPNCGNGMIEAGEGESCDPPGSSTCANSGNGLEVCSATCTCPCPSRVDFEGNATDAVTELDAGWTGIAHDSKIVSEGKVTVQITGCENLSKPCGVCTFTGPIENPAPDAGDINNLRCRGDSSIKCDTPGTDPLCTGLGNACVFNFGGPLPLSSGGVSTCVTNEIVGSITGTANVESGESASNLSLISRVHTGILTAKPCPKCTDTGGLNDGMNGGTCTDGPRAGQVCDANAESPIPAFGRTSLDCPPEPGSNIANLPIALNNSTNTETRTLSANSPSCTANGFQGLKCFCDTCNDDAAAPCSSNADCAPGRVCGGLRCLVDAGVNVGAACSSEGTNTDAQCGQVTAGICDVGVTDKCIGGAHVGLDCFSDSDCADASCNFNAMTGMGTCIAGPHAGGSCVTDAECGGTCGRPGEATKPHSCSTNCVAGGGGGGNDGMCQLSPSDQNCSIETFRSCTGDTQCQTAGCADCAPGQTCVTKRRECFRDNGAMGGSTSASGVENTPVNDTSTPTLASLFCIAPTGSAAVNNVAGLPGLGRLKLKGTARGLPAAP